MGPNYIWYHGGLGNDSGSTLPRTKSSMLELGYAPHLPIKFTPPSPPPPEQKKKGKAKASTSQPS